MKLCKDCVFYERADTTGTPFDMCKSRLRLYPSVIDGEILTDYDSLAHCWDRNKNGNCYDYCPIDNSAKQSFNPLKSLWYFWKWRYKRASIQDESSE